MVIASALGPRLVNAAAIEARGGWTRAGGDVVTRAINFSASDWTAYILLPLYEGWIWGHT